MGIWIRGLIISVVVAGAISLGYGIENKMVVLAINGLMLGASIITLNYEAKQKKNIEDAEREERKNRADGVIKLNDGLNKLLTSQEKIEKLNIKMLDVIKNKVIEAISEGNSEIISKLEEIEEVVENSEIKDTTKDIKYNLDGIEEILREEFVEKIEIMIKDNAEVNKEIVDRFIDLGAIEEKNIKLLKDSYAILNNQIEVQDGL